MTWIYDLATDVGKVRLNISDTQVSADPDGPAPLAVFSDEELEAFLGMEGDVLLASARALEVIAANEVLVQKRIKNLDLTTDGPSEARALVDIAERWRNQYDATLDPDDAGFDIAEVVYDDFTLRNRLANETLRSQ